MRFSDQLNLDKFLEIMDVQEYPLFGITAEKDEYESNESFFVYSQEGAIRPAIENHNQYLKEFTLSFFTKENAEIDVLGIAEQLKKARLRFTGTDIEEGEFADTGQRAKMTTLNFVHVIKVCEV